MSLFNFFAGMADAGAGAGDINLMTDVANLAPDVSDMTINNAADAMLVNPAGTDSSLMDGVLSKFGVGSVDSPDVWAGAQGAGFNAPGVDGSAAPVSDAGQSIRDVGAPASGPDSPAAGGGSGLAQWFNSLGPEAQKFVWGGLSQGAKAALAMFANPNKDARYLAAKYQTDEQAREYNQNRSDRERSHIPTIGGVPNNNIGIINSAMKVQG